MPALVLPYLILSLIVDDEFTLIGEFAWESPL